jgi:hypothetical protein
MLEWKKWTSLLEHRIEGPMTLYVIEWSIKSTAGTHYCALKRSGFVRLDRAIPHDVEALEACAFLLTVLQP